MKEIITMIKDNDPKGIEELEIFYKKLEATKDFIKKIGKSKMERFTITKDVGDFASYLAYENVVEMLNNLIEGE